MVYYNSYVEHNDRLLLERCLSMQAHPMAVIIIYNETLDTSKSEFRSCVKVEVAVLGSLSLTVIVVSVDVKQH